MSISLDSSSFFTTPIQWADVSEPQTDATTDVRNYKEVSFRETQLYSQIWAVAVACLSIRFAVSMIKLSFEMIDHGHKPALAFTVYMVSMISCMIIPLVTAVYLIEYIAYTDPNSRQQARLELENFEISIGDFIAKHGWDNIVEWGLRVPEDQEPLCTKEMLRDYFFSKYTTSSNNEGLVPTLKEMSFDLVTRDDIFREKVEQHFFSVDQHSTSRFLELLSYELFTPQQTEKLHQEFRRVIKEYSKDPKKLTVALLLNWHQIKQAGLDSVEELADWKPWLEENAPLFDPLYKLYMDKVNSIVAGQFFELGSQYCSVFIGDSQAVATKEVVDTMPKYTALFISFDETYNSEYIGTLNDWFHQHLDAILETRQN